MKKWEKNVFDPGKIQAAKLGKTNIVWSYQIDRFHSLFLHFQARNDGMTRQSKLEYEYSARTGFRITIFNKDKKTKPGQGEV